MNSNVQPHNAKERVHSPTLFVAFLIQEMQGPLATFASIQSSAGVPISLSRQMRLRVSLMFIRVSWQPKHWRMELSPQHLRDKVRERLPSWHANIHTRKQGMLASPHLTLTDVQQNWMHLMGCRKHAAFEHYWWPQLSPTNESRSPPLLNSIIPNCCSGCTCRFP